MASSIFSNSGQKAYGIKNFIVDTPSDIDSLPKTYTPGCVAFVIEDSSYYMLNHQKEWKKIQISSGSGGSGGGADPFNYDSAIYEGGIEG